MHIRSGSGLRDRGLGQTGRRGLTEDVTLLLHARHHGLGRLLLDGDGSRDGGLKQGASKKDPGGLFGRVEGEGGVVDDVVLQDHGLLVAGRDARNALAALDLVDYLQLAQRLAGQQQRLDAHHLGRAVELEQLPRHLGALGDGHQARLQRLVDPHAEAVLHKVELLRRKGVVRVHVRLERQVSPFDKPRRDFGLDSELRDAI